MNAFPSIDFSKLDISRLDLTKIDLPKIDLTRLDLPKFDLPKFDLGQIDAPEIDVDTVTAFARDAAYVSIGLTVLAFQQAQVRRRELQASLEQGVRKLVDTVS
jgi:hypothetical protein